MLGSGYYITTTTLMAIVISLVVTTLITWRLIPYLKRLKASQTILDDVPEAHKLKAGTPTMGGIAIIVGACVGTLIAAAISGFSANVAIILAVFVIFGLIGFIDDYTKVMKKRNLGLRARQKLLLQVIVALAVAFYYVFVARMGTSIIIPFIWKYVDIGYFIIPYIAFIIVAATNAVNLTDGLDGLAGGIGTVVTLFYPALAILGLGLSMHTIGGGLGINFIRNEMIDTLYFMALAGACIGFLIFNRHPAKIFMGDTGSLAIGGGLAVCAIFVRMELLLPIVGIVFVVEALSDIIQVASYKLRHGKRVFKMAPLHHHFEMSGWKERKVVTVFVSFTLIVCAVMLVILLVQSQLAVGEQIVMEK